jgi:hypothetical protein
LSVSWIVWSAVANTDSVAAEAGATWLTPAASRHVAKIRDIFDIFFLAEMVTSLKF